MKEQTILKNLAANVKNGKLSDNDFRQYVESTLRIFPDLANLIDESVRTEESKDRCKNPCPECAYRKDSPKGYFGGNDPQIYRDAYNSDNAIPCHMKSKFDDKGELIATTHRPCIGQALAQIKSCKRVNDPATAALHDELRKSENIDKLKDSVLAVWEFESHHLSQD